MLKFNEKAAIVMYNEGCAVILQVEYKQDSGILNQNEQSNG